MTIILDGPKGMVKSTLIDALQTRLADEGLTVIKSDRIGLLDCLVDSAAVKRCRRNKSEGKISLVDTNYLFSLAKAYYGPADSPSYETLNRAIEIASENLTPSAVVVVDSTPTTSAEQDIQRGYLWEAHQRGYLSLSAIGDVEPVFDQICSIALMTQPRDNTPDHILKSEATPVSEILGKKTALKTLSRKPVQQQRHSKSNRPRRRVDKKHQKPYNLT